MKEKKQIQKESISWGTLLSLIILTLSLSCLPISHSVLKKPPPLPILPIPTAPQLQWQLASMALFLHFGPNTFTDSEWGSGHADPSVFNPSKLNASQWVQVAKDSGFDRVILTAKHHDGFCLWPSEYTDYSVKSSSWRDGSGDVVKELALAAKEAGVGLGLYLSPWDRHEVSYGKTLEYNEFYMGQMTELLTWYGEIKEVWLDGAKGEGEKDMEYFFDSWFSLIHQHQPGAIIFSDAGPDSRWIGDEGGIARSTCWSLFNRSAAKIGGTDPIYEESRVYEQGECGLTLNWDIYSGGGDPFGHDWVPAECDVSIRPGWFWHPMEVPKSAEQLLDIYYNSVGRNCLLLLNVPPNSSGLISDEDVQVLQEFSELRRCIFSYNLASISFVNASSTRGGNGDSCFDPHNVLKEGIDTYWAPEDNQSDWMLYLDLQNPISFNVLQVQEPIQMGQRVIAFHLEILSNSGNWRQVCDGTTVGYNRLLRFSTVESQHLKFVVDKSRGVPLISFLGVYIDQFSVLGDVIDRGLQISFNSSQAFKEATTYNHSRVAAV